MNNRNAAKLPYIRATNRIRPIYIEDDLGYSRAANLGAREATGNYLAFCDSDTYVLPGWIEAHVAHHKVYPKAGISSGLILNAQTGRILDFGIGRTYYNHFHPFRNALAAGPLVETDRRAQMACSANMMLPRDLFFSLGAFDENLLRFYQDVDLCLRLKDMGKECWVLAGARAFHKGAFWSKPRPAIQVDERGYYTAKNIHRLEVDYDQYLSLNLNQLLQKRSFDKEYMLVDLSTIHPSSISEALSHHINFAESGARFSPQARDIGSICLLEHLDINILRSRLPIVFFVDVFDCLRPNALWAERRRNNGDLVIDRHANIYTFDDIVAGRC